MTLSNLPPGVSDCMIPGNSRDDALIDDICDRCDEEECRHERDLFACPQIRDRHERGI